MLERRTFLKSLFAGAGCGVGAGGLGAGAAGAVRPANADLPGARAGLLGASAGLPSASAMANAVIATPRRDVPELAAEWVARGATHQDLLAAAYLAALREIRPRPMGGRVHALMMVSSASSAAATLPGAHKLVPAVFNLDRVKYNQARDAQAGDWVLPDAPAFAAKPRTAFAADFDHAMEDWDEAEADRAITALQANTRLDDCYELIWPWAMRDFRLIGHKAIYAAQSYRALMDLGWRHGQPAVRSLVLGLFDQKSSGDDPEERRILAIFAANQRLSGRLPETWRIAPADPDASLALLRRMRTADPHEAAEAIVAAARAGASAASLWDGLRLHAFELVHWCRTIAGVHGVTSVNALHRTFLYTRSDATARLALLQAASWLTLFPAVLQQRTDAEPEAHRIDALRAAKSASPRDPFTADTRDEGSRRAVAMLEHGALAPFAARTYELLARKALHDHDYKFAAAALEEIAAAHPRWRPLLAGASLSYLRTAASDDSALYRNAWPRLRDAAGRRRGSGR